MKLTKNFSLSEWDCKDGTPVPKNLIPNVKEVARNIQVLRDYIKVPIEIISGYRTPSHNKKVGGAKFSQHLQGKAADLRTAPPFTPKELHVIIERLIKQKKMHNGGLGLYKTFVHVDIGQARRWKGEGV